MSHLLPPPRAGHSAILYHDQMIVFGGKDEDNNKLNDIWAFDFPTSKWSEIQLSETNYIKPTIRSGHSACLYNDIMIVFGGIHEVTKELNDLCAFDFKQNKWVQFFEEMNSPAKRGSSANSSRKKDDSP